MKAVVAEMVRMLPDLVSSVLVERVGLCYNGNWILRIGVVHVLDHGSAMIVSEVVGERIVWHWFQTESIDSVDADLNPAQCSIHGVEFSLPAVLTYLKTKKTRRKAA